MITVITKCGLHNINEYFADFSTEESKQYIENFQDWLELQAQDVYCDSREWDEEIWAEYKEMMLDVLKYGA